MSEQIIVDEHTITELPVGTRFHIADMHLQDRLIAEQVMKNLKFADGKWRSPIDLLMGVDDNIVPQGIRVLNILADELVLQRKTETVPSATRSPYQYHRPTIDLLYFKQATFP